jgi:hypothetical protein
MSDKEGTLRMMPSGQYAVCRPGETPHEITSGDLFYIEFAGKLHLTRMKGALSDMEPTAWVHKSCLEEYSNHTGGDAKEIAALGKMIDVDDDDPEDFVHPSAKKWTRPSCGSG